MSRHSGSSRRRGAHGGRFARGQLRSDREFKDQRVLRAFRRVEQDDVMRLGGAFTSLSQSGDIPLLNHEKVCSFMYSIRG